MSMKYEEGTAQYLALDNLMFNVFDSKPRGSGIQYVCMLHLDVLWQGTSPLNELSLYSLSNPYLLLID